jgi:uncharacterized glyoxalase superfamily protein PhnB
MTAAKLGNLVPYLFYSDIEAMIAWYHRVFGFVDKQRWRRPDGTVHNAEMTVGDTQLWMDGGPNSGRHKLTDADGNPVSLWVGVWLEDPEAVDAMYNHIVSEGVEPVDQPGDRPFGIRTFNVKDPEGYTWGFMCEIPRPE